MTYFPGESNTRNNLLAYKYTGKKSTDYRSPRGLEDGSQRWNWRHVRLATCAKFCSFVPQTVRSSVRSFYKLYDALFACSTKMNVCFVRLIFKRTWLWSVRSIVFIGQLWCRIHWILQPRVTNTILYDCIPVILFLYSERIQHGSTTEVWLTGVQGYLPTDKLNAKTESPFCLYFGIQYSFGFQ